MKILQIVPSISLVYGGPSQMILGLAPALAEAGVKVTVLTTNSNGDRGQKPLNVPLNVPVTKDGYDIVYFRCAPFQRYKFSLDLCNWLNRYGNNFDLAHIHALFSPVSSVAANICRQKAIPYILRPLGTLDPADLRKKKFFKQVYAGILEKANIAGAAAMHFTSEQESKVSHRFGAKTQDLVLPLGVYPPKIISAVENPIRSQFNIDDALPIILFMSRIDPKKGLDLLIPSLEKLLADGYNFHFVLAGTNPQDPNYEEKIKSQIHNSSLRSRTTITGFVTGEMKSALLQAADIFVLPSYYENFGIAVAEAMVAGKPVVISDQVHICNEVRDNNCGWVCPMDVPALTAALRTGLENPEERYKRGNSAKEYALRQYSWQAIAQQTVNAYERIISCYKN
ncbi:hormogonium polysaccharide biosynthesis glycosyltransferase HpsP [Calothrix sp. 336/3]|uniref:hormogonium polysaccharide biosynthesis glycosyltransferase HpsP n=1 Tax=Calothrix sp. 336/3 TaxID=1337936 RepID=UPI0004E45429|nr:hormogonium polysaccharide biosynthesis glycosyltransferase HpsP [Calothrix sp. 336/3]AKG22588.1 glycosyl transferase group 1 [Calothrix sp. 336/3]